RERHRDEMLQYIEAFGAGAEDTYGFVGKTLYRTSTGFQLFREAEDSNQNEGRIHRSCTFRWRAARTVRMSRNILCGPFSNAPSIGTKPYRAYQLTRSRYASVMMQRQPTSSATRKLMRNASEIRACPTPRP